MNKFPIDWTIEVCIDYVKLSEIGCMSSENEQKFIAQIAAFYEDFQKFPEVGDTIFFDIEDDGFVCQLGKRHIYLRKKIIQFDFNDIMNSHYSWFSDLQK